MIKNVAGQTVAKASSRKQAARYAQQWDAVAGARASAEVYAKVMRRLEKAHGVAKGKTGGGKRRCGSCGKYSKALTPNHNFCSHCGHGLNGQGAAKASGAGPARSRCSGCGLLAKAGADNCNRCGYKLPPPSVADSGEAEKSFTCAGCDSAVHADRGSCPFCGQVRPAVKKSAGVPGLDRVHLTRLVAKAQNGADSNERAEALAAIVEKVGREVAAQLVGGDLLSPSQFTRAYLSQHRAPLSAPAGQTPRIPDTSHTISSDDFRRPPLMANHQRPNPLDRLMDPGQVAAYRSGAGIPESSPYQGAPSGTTVWPALAAARSAFARAPMPGDARG